MIDGTVPRPKAAGHIALTSSDEWHARAVHMTHEVLMLVTEISPTCIVVEVPNNWFTAKGLASKDAEDVQKLYFVVGGLCATLHAAAPFTKQPIEAVWAVTPSGWKGQLPKSVSEERMCDWLAPYFGGTVPSMENDTWDAIHLAHATITRAVLTNAKPGIAPPDNWTLVGGRMVHANPGVRRLTVRTDYDV